MIWLIYLAMICLLGFLASEAQRREYWGLSAAALFGVFLVLIIALETPL